MDERRIAERVPLSLEVRWDGLSGKRSARISDISLTGCYVESLGQVTLGEEIHLEIQTPTGRWITVSGEVAHRDPNMGFGVRFTSLSDLEHNMLIHVIDYARDF